jgi:hypothetical protein
MDREREIAYLMHAEKAVALCEQHIADQERRVAQLDRDGHNTNRSVALLGLYRRLQAQHVALCRLVLKQLEQDAKRAKLDVGPIFRPGHYDPR